MEKIEYLKLIEEEIENTLFELKSLSDKDKIKKSLLNLKIELIRSKDEDYKIVFDRVTNSYLKSVEAISKLSPGLSAGLYDEKLNIKLNTYNGKMSDIPNDDYIMEKTVFDASSITKMFTSILLLKEEERGNIDLDKKFSDYSPLLKSIDVKIIDALRFGVELRTNGRLDEKGISKNEREERFKSTYVFKKDTFLYSDVPYMLVPLLFGKTLEEATENYIRKFYEFYRYELNLSMTGYSLIDMTGGTVNVNLDKEKISYNKDKLYDPKADIFEKKLGYISAHAGVTTTVSDLEKLFLLLSHGLLNHKSLKTLTTTISPETKLLLDKKGKLLLKDDSPIIINRAMGVYINTGNIRECDIPSICSSTSFASAGSSGTYCVFDIENGFNMSYLSNIKSGLFHKWINTDDYTYGDINDEMPKHFSTTLISGTHTNKDGGILRPDGTLMTYVRATNNFKEEGIKTLIKLRIAKKVLLKKAYIEFKDDELIENLKTIDLVFSGKKESKTKSKTI